MTDKDLKTGLDKLLFELYNSHEKKKDKIVIKNAMIADKNNYHIDKNVLAKAAQLRIKYQEEKIKQGIQIVFNELNK